MDIQDIVLNTTKLRIEDSKDVRFMCDIYYKESVLFSLENYKFSDSTLKKLSEILSAISFNEERLEKILSEFKKVESQGKKIAVRFSSSSLELEDDVVYIGLLRLAETPQYSYLMALADIALQTIRLVPRNSIRLQLESFCGEVVFNEKLYFILKITGLTIRLSGHHSYVVYESDGTKVKFSDQLYNSVLAKNGLITAN